MEVFKYLTGWIYKVHGPTLKAHSLSTKIQHGYHQCWAICLQATPQHQCDFFMPIFDTPTRHHCNLLPKFDTPMRHQCNLQTKFDTPTWHQCNLLIKFTPQCNHNAILIIIVIIIIILSIIMIIFIIILLIHRPHNIVLLNPQLWQAAIRG